MRSRSGSTIAATLAVGLFAATAAASPAPCPGPYLLADGTAPLIVPSATVARDAVVMRPGDVMIRSGCPFAPLTVRKANGAWIATARWRRCGSMRKVRLRGTIAGDCARIDGRLRVGHTVTRFSAALSTCGDGVIDREGGESCEPPGTGTCSTECRQLYPVCGDGHLDPGEECDDGNTRAGDGCTSCRLPRCGDGIVDPGEQCDDGNDADDDGCTTTCQVACDQHTFDSTWDAIQARIFTPTCAIATCHGPGGSGNLDLSPGIGPLSLVDVLADNPAARAAGKKRVVPGDPAASFLSQKLHGVLLGDEGTPMPLVGPALRQIQLDAIDAWIRAGAEQTGIVPGAPCLPAPEYHPAPALVPPPGGYQLILDGPVLQPGQEQEGCLWVQVPNTSDLAVAKFEFSLNPGTHHFAIFAYQGAGTPQAGVWQVNNFGCFNGASFGGSIAGTPQAPYYVNVYPPGVARVLRAGSYIGLNAHYYNEFPVPIQIKVWINVYPYDGTPVHEAKTLQSLDSTYSISVPPFTQQVHPGRYVNSTGKPLTFLAVSGHMHFRGLRFTAWQSDRTKVYESFDWGHPGGRGFEPPYVLTPGDYFDYECLYDNGVQKPVRRDGAGNPTTLRFGVSAEDAMCILTGTYYED